MVHKTQKAEQSSRISEYLGGVAKYLLGAVFNSEGLPWQTSLCEYRKAGLPITSSLVESTVKQINHRVKGTEKFWTEEGAEAILQMRADQLSEDGAMDEFWQRREQEASGLRRYRSKPAKQSSRRSRKSRENASNTTCASG